MTGPSTAAPARGGDRNMALGVAALVSAARVATLTTAAMVLPIGCAEPEPIEIVAQRGCGLDQEFSGLRVRVLGDFVASAGTELLLGPGEQRSIPTLPDEATGVAAEGLFGTTVTAIGRSYGIDPTLARGRVPGVDDDALVLPVYFAKPDTLCDLDAQPSARTDVAAAAGQGGDVVLVGGLGPNDELLAEVVHLDLFSGEVRTLAGELPSPRRGASVHGLGGRRFMVLGGAGPDGVAGDTIEVDVRGSGEVGLSSFAVPGVELAIVDHAVADATDGRVLLAGGCEQANTSGVCVPTSAIARTAWLDLGAPAASIELPDLVEPRFGAHAAVATDGVAFVAGGFGLDGLGLASVERLTPGGSWAIVHSLPDDRAIAGLMLLDGGLVVLSDRLGGVHWWSEVGAGDLDPTSRAPALGPIVGERPLLGLPGERGLVDNWLFAPATAAVDPAVERVLLGEPARTGARLIALADGTVLVVGGRPSDALATLATPTLLRLRPELDGPDEWIPDLAGPQTDAFVCNAPGRATVVVGGLQLDADGSSEAIASVHAHVRGFRSAAFRLEFEWETDPGAVAQVMLGQGAMSVVSVALLDDGIVVRQRHASGEIETLDCALAGVEPGTPVVVELDDIDGVDDQGQRLRLTTDSGLVAECGLDWPSPQGVSVGFGAAGSGSVRVFGLRLARR